MNKNLRERVYTYKNKEKDINFILAQNTTKDRSIH